MSKAVRHTTAELAKDDATEPNRSRAYDEDAVTLSRIGAAICMGADSQELYHRRLIKSRAIGCGDIFLRDADEFCHSAVDMHAEDCDALTAVCLTAPARHAGAARQIGDQIDSLTNGDAAAGARLRNLACQFVPQDSRVFQKGMRAFVDMEIRAAYARAPDAHQHLAGSRCGPGSLDYGQAPWFDALQCTHPIASDLPVYCR
jgi:hypothetical protein